MSVLSNIVQVRPFLFDSEVSTAINSAFCFVSIRWFPVDVRSYLQLRNDYFIYFFDYFVFFFFISPIISSEHCYSSLYSFLLLFLT